MLASGAITSTAGVITSFSCIRCLLLHPVPWTRVLPSRGETPRTPHGAAAGVTRTALHGRLALSRRKFHATRGLGGPSRSSKKPRALSATAGPRTRSPQWRKEVAERRWGAGRPGRCQERVHAGEGRGGG